MKNITMMILVGAMLLFGVLVIEGHSGEMGVGLSYMEAGHSEGNESDGNNRCVNEGVGVDVGYDWEPLSYDLYKYLGVSLKMGGLLTYVNYETAQRDNTRSPESDQKRESSVTLLAVVKPTLEIGIVKPYMMFGIGPDYMQSRDFGIGYVKNGYGVDVDFAKDYSLGISKREMMRFDGSMYRVYTATFKVEF
jgi:hypothetical protein